ncbi:MAG: HAD-IA family hydrolase [Spirochaetes bacterium]|nr:HAD-IA family hydrolase [Spirochaetota bacterium]
MNHIELLMFDLDGTLIDSGMTLVYGAQYVLSRFNISSKDINAERIKSYMGGDGTEFLRKVFNDFEVTGNIDLKTALQYFDEFFRENPAKGSELFPNVLEVLDFFSSKRKIILTNRSKEVAEYTLKHLDIAKYFEDIIGADGNECFKPSACPIKKALSHMIIDKHKSLMVGDMNVDIQAGKNAGVLTCGVTYGIGTREEIEKENPDFLIDDIIELKKIAG